MATEKSTASSTIDNEVAIANLHGVRGSATARTLSTVVPRPTIAGDETSSTRAKGVVFALALNDGRGVMDIGKSCLRHCVAKYKVYNR